MKTTALAALLLALAPVAAHAADVEASRTAATDSERGAHFEGAVRWGLSGLSVAAVGPDSADAIEHGGRLLNVDLRATWSLPKQMRLGVKVTGGTLDIDGERLVPASVGPVFSWRGLYVGPTIGILATTEEDTLIPFLPEVGLSTGYQHRVFGPLTLSAGVEATWGILYMRYAASVGAGVDF